LGQWFNFPPAGLLLNATSAIRGDQRQLFSQPKTNPKPANQGKPAAPAAAAAPVKTETMSTFGHGTASAKARRWKAK